MKTICIIILLLLTTSLFAQIVDKHGMDELDKIYLERLRASKKLRMEEFQKIIMEIDNYRESTKKEDYSGWILLGLFILVILLSSQINPSPPSK